MRTLVKFKEGNYLIKWKIFVYDPSFVVLNPFTGEQVEVFLDGNDKKKKAVVYTEGKKDPHGTN